MKTEAKEKLRRWLSQFPETTHQLDSERLYDLVIALEDTDSSIEDEDIREMLKDLKPKWTEDFIEDFIHSKQLLIEELRFFLRHYRTHH
ncbi:MAG: hypothetical protein K2G90_07360 [Muribaculaceae bacterium]|nr:hypothetical protein [Muribaculaceae bacterium]